MVTGTAGDSRRFVMKRASRITIRLGLDGNPLRRHVDKISVVGTAGLLAVFLAGAPVAAIATGHAVAAAAAAEQHHQRTWRMTQATLLQEAAVPPGEYDGGYDSWTWARWTTPTGHTREGLIEARAGAEAGTHTAIWVTPSGRWPGTPLTGSSAGLRVALAITATIIMLAAALLCVSAVLQCRLDRHRLAGWEASWKAVGPQWTRQFRSRGL
jgi:hypothetical protein